MDEKKETTFINYHFRFEDGTEQYLLISLRLNDLSHIPEVESKKPKWTKLEFNKCENCPLNAKDDPYCPVALSISGIINKFRNRKSYEKILLRVETPERLYEKKTPLQQGLGSLLGIFMVTTGCPVMRILRPMVRFHLPFATIEETVYRSASCYLLGQYFKVKKDKKPDWDLKGLAKAYEEIQKVNLGITNRLRSISDEDANANAIIVLDVFAKALSSSIFVDLRELEYLYQDLLDIF